MDEGNARTSPLLISIAPTSSSFFAGEEFQCVLTFTNTRIPAPSTQPLPSTATFGSNATSDARRIFSSAASLGGASGVRRHSKSASVDVRTFARQLNLEGVDEAARDEGYYRQKQRESIDAAAAAASTWASITPEQLDDELPKPRGLIGRGAFAAGSGAVTPTNDSITFKQHRQTMSLSMPPGTSATGERSGLGMGLPHPSSALAATAANPRRVTSTTTPPPHLSLTLIPPSSSSGSLSGRSASNSISNSTLRTPSGPIAPHHPHGRKKSVAAIQAEDLSSAFALDPTAEAGAAASTPPITPSEPSTPRTNGAFYGAGAGANDTLESVLRDDISAAWARPNGAGVSPSAASSRRSSVSNVAAHYPEGTVSLLWTFAQFGGEFKLDESLVKPAEFEELKRRLALDQTVMGGGEFAVGGANGAGAQDKAGWGSMLTGGLFGRRSSVGPRGHGRSASTMGEKQVRTLEARALPLFSTPPSVVAVDLNLAPGESKSFTFRIPLPPDLPPSYMGKAISFTYTLTIGTNRIDRATRVAPASRQSLQKSRLIRIPFRVYNHVGVTGALGFFDLGNPVVNRKDMASVEAERDDAEDVRIALKRRGSGSGKDQDRTPKVKTPALVRQDFEAYARQLLASCHDDSAIDDADAPTDLEVASSAAASARGLLSAPSPSSSPTTLRVRTSSFNNMPRPSSPFGRRVSTVSETLAVEEDDLPKTSMEAVEVLSRNSQKVSYDISKDGQIAAVLTLVKSKYRLGDTVAGVVTMNQAGAIARVVRIAATLETHEVIQPSLATLPPARVQRATRCVHAECHESTLDAGQVNFSLPIPSGATPDFVTSAVKLVWTVRLSFLTLAAVRPADGSMRTAPPPHLNPLASDGYEHFHQSLVALPALAGPSPDPALASVSEGTKLEVVECAVPLNVLPHSTRFKPGEASVYA